MKPLTTREHQLIYWLLGLAKEQRPATPPERVAEFDRAIREAHVLLDQLSPPQQAWVTLTKRTEDPKLAWLEKQLAAKGIASRRKGHSFHAPILQVQSEGLDQAWNILTPVDDVPDDDPRFQ